MEAIVAELKGGKIVCVVQDWIQLYFVDIPLRMCRRDIETHLNFVLVPERPFWLPVMIRKETRAAFIFYQDYKKTQSIAFEPRFESVKMIELLLHSLHNFHRHLHEYGWSMI